ncbi:MAG TPA: hypothetical protein VE690_20120 [Rhodopila sp.]|nr:hypothetical protein [Rhodopila sp.]
MKGREMSQQPRDDGSQGVANGVVTTIAPDPDMERPVSDKLNRHCRDRGMDRAAGMALGTGFERVAELRAGFRKDVIA